VAGAVALRTPDRAGPLAPDDGSGPAAPLGVDRRTARILWTVLVIGGALALLYALRSVVLLVVFAAFFAYLLWPVVSATQRWLRVRSRALATALVYLVLFGGLAGGAAAVGPRFSDDVRGLADRIPKTPQEWRSSTMVGDTLQRYGVGVEIIREVETQIRSHAGDIVGYTQRAVTRTLSWLAGAWVIVLVPIFAFFILKDAETFVAAVSGLFTRPSQRRRWLAITEDLHHLLADYVRALFLLALITAFVWSMVFLLAGVPFAAGLAILGGALEFIPLLGPLVAGIVVVTALLFTGYGHVLAIVGFIVLWRFVQDYVSSPLVMGRGIEMHPAVVIFGVIAGGELAGPVGMFLSVPVMAGVRILWRHAGSGRGGPDPARDDTARVR
jgi:predicted PurR-regulated permease PerM